MKLIFLLSLLTSLSFASSHIETNRICIDGKLFIQTVVMAEFNGHNDWRPISASLTQIFEQWGSHVAVVQCKKGVSK